MWIWFYPISCTYSLPAAFSGEMGYLGGELAVPLDVAGGGEELVGARRLDVDCDPLIEFLNMLRKKLPYIAIVKLKVLPYMYMIQNTLYSLKTYQQAISFTFMPIVHYKALLIHLLMNYT